MLSLPAVLWPSPAAIIGLGLLVPGIGAHAGFAVMTDLQKRNVQSPAPANPEASPNLADQPLPAHPDSTGSQAASPAPSDGRAHQFTLAGILLVVGLFGILLGPVIWLRLPWFAGVLGCGSLLVLAVISIFNNRPHVVQVGWWLLAALYVSALTLYYIFS